MSRPSCPRRWEAEAVEDRRLDGAGRASFERHVTACPECAREVDLLAKLRSLDGILPSPAPSALDRKRRRSALLRRANEQILSQPKAMWQAARPLAFAVALIAGVIVLALWVPARRRVTKTALSDSPIFEIKTVDGARWNLVRDGSSTEVALLSGTVAVEVERLGQDKQFVLTLPDGQIEVRGTRFSVEAGEERTQRVAVTEGMVALRIAGKAERWLSAGEFWVNDEPAIAAPEPSAEHSAAAPEIAEPAKKLRAVRSRNATASKGGKPAPVRDDRGAPSSSSNPESHSAGALFAQAMAAFDSRSYAAADQLFDRFERAFPDDARREDAAFLRIVCALRRGDRHAVEQHAHAYLGAYPNGLRRGDVERLLR